jgi:hypothetical protein
MIRNGQGTSGDARTCNHIQAIINGGPNRESNLHPLCEWCEPAKTEADVHEKSRSYRRRLRHVRQRMEAPRARPSCHRVRKGVRAMVRGPDDRSKNKRVRFVGSCAPDPDAEIDRVKLVRTAEHRLVFCPAGLPYQVVQKFEVVETVQN